MLTQNRLKELLYYDSETGVFTRKSDTPNGRWKRGERVGWKMSHGYRSISIDGREETEHRLAFLYVTGSIPDEIDHIDMDRANNSFANLRSCNSSQNKGNQKLSSRNKSGLKGVYFCPRRNKYEAHIGKKNLGRFPTAEAAHQAYREAAEKLFGEFARAT